MHPANNPSRPSMKLQKLIIAVPEKIRRMKIKIKTKFGIAMLVSWSNWSSGECIKRANTVKACMADLIEAFTLYLSSAKPINARGRDIDIICRNKSDPVLRYTNRFTKKQEIII